MKLIITFLFLACLLASCTPQHELRRHERKAQRLLSRAIRQDPSIITKQYTDTLIKGHVRYVNDLKTDALQAQSRAFRCDSVMDLLDSMQVLLHKKGDSITKPQLYLMEDSTMKISVVKDKRGGMSVAVDVKPQTIHVDSLIPYQVEVKVPGKVVEKRVPYPAWKYWWFWALLAYSALATYLFIRQRKRTKTTKTNL